MLQGRKTLPAWKCRQAFLTTMAQHRGMVVTGETGCGKTTQIPQFLLEVEPHCKVLVCQPRRLAAIGVATRVAEEMACDLGEEVGYMVRGASASSARTRLVFCTYGVLLRRLLQEPDLDGINYVILDEVHERGIDSDFALGLLAAALGRSQCRFKLVLMSATISTAKFADYLGKANAGAFAGAAPVLEIPGYTYAVTEYYKEQFEPALPSLGGRAQGAETSGIAGRKRKRTRTRKTDVAQAVMLERASGSVLVFLPGVPEITRFCTLLSDTWREQGGELRLPILRVMSLHAGTNPADQKLVFRDAEHNEIKIIAATNVAEASITIPDVSVVVDSCKVKETDFDAQKQMNMLALKFASKDALRQRRGRAGRVSAGRCFRAVTTNTYQNLANHGIPEMLRASIDGLVLQIKSMDQSSLAKETVEAQLRRCPDPPPLSVIHSSETLLKRMQALDENGEITPLGRHLSQLPCTPKVGRLLMYGCLLGCTQPLAYVAALLTSRSPFMTFPDQDSRDKLNAIKERFGAEAGGRSDQLVITSVCAAFEKCKGMSAQRRFCQDHMLNFNRMTEIAKLARDFLSDLANIGLIGQSCDSPCNINIAKPKLVSAAVCAGLYPQALRILRPPKRFEEVMGGAFEKETSSQEIKLYEALETGTSDDIDTTGMFRAYVHPSSIHFTNNSFGKSQFVMYGETRLQVTPGKENKSYVQDLTEVDAYPLLFFGGKLEAQYLQGTITVDGWMKFSASGKLVALIQALRRAMDDLLLEKLENAGVDHSEHPVMQSVFALLNSPGGLR
eukprot:GSChrysophyteH2.ASY1.ANO1.1027.1 assembled CDS